MAWRVWDGIRGIGPSWVRGCHGPAACARFRRGRRVPAPAARAMGAGVPRTVARERCECPEDARNAACRIRRRFLRWVAWYNPRIYAARCDAVWRGVACLGRYIVGIGPPWVRGCHGPAARARFCLGRRVTAPAARAMGAGVLRTAARERFERSFRHKKRGLGQAACGFCRWVAWYILGYMRRVVMRYGVACLGRYIVG